MTPSFWAAECLWPATPLTEVGSSRGLRTPSRHARSGSSALAPSAASLLEGLGHPCPSKGTAAPQPWHALLVRGASRPLAHQALGRSRRLSCPCSPKVCLKREHGPAPSRLSCGLTPRPHHLRCGSTNRAAATAGRDPGLLLPADAVAVEPLATGNSLDFSAPHVVAVVLAAAVIGLIGVATRRFLLASGYELADLGRQLAQWVAFRVLRRRTLPASPWICARCLSHNPLGASGCYRCSALRVDSEMMPPIGAEAPAGPGAGRSVRHRRRS